MMFFQVISQEIPKGLRLTLFRRRFSNSSYALVITPYYGLNNRCGFGCYRDYKASARVMA